jgi:hypothetical protein
MNTTKEQLRRLRQREKKIQRDMGVTKGYFPDAHQWALERLTECQGHIAKLSGEREGE